VLVAEALADPSNLGALIRNARALGADAVICGARGADPFERRAIRAAMGHGFALPIAVVDDLPRWVDTWRSAAAHEPARAAWALTTGPQARSLIELCARAGPPLPRHLALLLGNEGNGLSDALRDRADMEVTIPLAPAVDSLNVAATSAVVLFALATRGEITSRDDPASPREPAR
jgi:tRNA G18 (ribose-2'-O)-methylase SpoU